MDDTNLIKRLNPRPCEDTVENVFTSGVFCTAIVSRNLTDYDVIYVTAALTKGALAAGSSEIAA